MFKCKFIFWLSKCIYFAEEKTVLNHYYCLEISLGIMVFWKSQTFIIGICYYYFVKKTLYIVQENIEILVLPSKDRFEAHKNVKHKML